MDAQDRPPAQAPLLGFPAGETDASPAGEALNHPDELPIDPLLPPFRPGDEEPHANMGSRVDAAPAPDRSTETAETTAPTPAEAAEAAEAEPERERSGWTALPFATYAPETGLGLGGFGVFFFRLPGERTESRPSSIAADILLTTRLQAIVELIPEFYFDEERWNLWTKWDVRLFPNSFWGIGADLPDNEERYSSFSLRGRAWLRRQIWDRLYAGANVDAQHFSLSDLATGGILDTQDIHGEEGGFTLGLGVTLDYDNRDNVVETYEGGYYQLQLMHWNNAWGSDYQFTRLTTDLRQFFHLGKTHALAFQLYGVFNFGEDVPFYQMGALGGPNLMRGYFEGRFRETTYVLTQMEYRFPIWWRFRGAAFLGIGDVAPHLEDLDFGSLEVAGGLSLQFRLNEQERFSIRFDVALNRRGQVAPYLYASEAF